MKLPSLSLRRLAQKEWFGWTVPVLVSLGILTWGAVIYNAVGDKPRTWEYGTYPYIPSESYASTTAPQGARLPRLVTTPPAIPEEK